MQVIDTNHGFLEELGDWKGMAGKCLFYSIAIGSFETLFPCTCTMLGEKVCLQYHSPHPLAI